MLQVTCWAICEEAGRLGPSLWQGRQRVACFPNIRKKPDAGGTPISETLLEAMAAGAAAGHGRVLPGSGAGERGLPTPQ